MYKINYCMYLCIKYLFHFSGAFLHHLAKSPFYIQFKCPESSRTQKHLLIWNWSSVLWKWKIVFENWLLPVPIHPNLKSRLLEVIRWDHLSSLLILIRSISCPFSMRNSSCSISVRNSCHSISIRNSACLFSIRNT